MSFLGNLFGGSPSMPPPPPPPPPAAAAPTMANAQVQGAGANQRARAAGAAMGGTEKTGPQGLVEPATTGTRSLLG